jgi:hypothetical protein
MSSPLNHYNFHDSPKIIPHLVYVDTFLSLNRLWAMSLAPHSCIPTKFDGDVFFVLLLIDILEGHYGWMQGIDKQYDNHAWCKVKTTK